MPIDCWKTSSSTYANVNSPTKSLGKIVKYSSPKLTDYYNQMGRKNNMSMLMSLSINRRGKWAMGLSLSANTRKKIGKWVYRCSL